jgi:hypothetical protein
LELRYKGWRDAIEGLSEAEWSTPLGPTWEEYADDNTIDLYNSGSAAISGRG